MKTNADILLKMYQHLSDEFYRNEENRWKYFAAISGFLSVLLVVLQLFPQAATLALIALMVTSLAGLLVLVSIYRIIIAIDKILTETYRELLTATVPKTKVRQLSYPESTQFLRGYSYFFSIHNALTTVFAGFFSMAATMLAATFIDVPQWIYVTCGLGIWVALLLVVWKASNLGFKYLEQ